MKIADFGVAKLSEPSSDPTSAQRVMTGEGIVLGTAAYMSPEQAAGEAVDARSDLFSLGCILYEMLSGRRAFTGDSNPAIIAAVLRNEPPPVERAPRLVRALVERCMRKKAADRFQSAAEVIAAIEKCGRVSTPGGAGERASVAVLPFANMSGAREDDYVCEGLAEEIINVLTTVPGLAVIARTSAFAVARLGLDACEIGARLGVDTILEGSVRRSGGRVRVTAQLIETTKGAHLWSERYDRGMMDVLALEDEIAGAIALRLRGELGQRRAQRVPAPGAHEAYLEGRYHFARATADELMLARSSYERALALDPNFALAHESLGELDFYVGFYGMLPPREAFAMSAWHAARAIELDEGLAEAHALLGTLRKELDYNWPEVHREMSRAMELNPASPVVRTFRAASEWMPQGRVEEALAEFQDLVRADPLSVWLRTWVGIHLVLTRRPELVIAEANRIIEMDPSYALAHWLLGIGHAMLDRYTEAVAALERANELSGGTSMTASFLAWAYGLAGQKDRARAFIPAAERGEAYIAPSVPALACIGLKEWDEAFVWLNRAIDARDPQIIPIKTDPVFDPMRDDPRFMDLLRKMKLA